MDNHLARFEGAAGAAIERITAAGSLDDEESWLYVLNLAALFVVRHPTQREMRRAGMERIAKLLANVLIRDPTNYARQMEAAAAAGFVDKDSGVTFEQMREFITAGEYSITVSNERHLDFEFRLFEDVLQTMVARRWSLMHAAPSAGEFVTSDLPVFLVSTKPRAGYSRPRLGHAMRDTVLCLPLTRHWFALGEHGGPTGSFEADTKTVAELNSIVLERAYREVYAPSQSATFALGGELVRAEHVIEHLAQQQRTTP